jgi:AcrR family transcriptional regulator
MSGPAVSRRERLRRQTIEEARRIALRQLAEVGTGGISLNAIAREMGMTGPALYRYIPSREALLTDLVLDAYRDLGDAIWDDLDATAGQDPASRLRSQAWALRAWTLANPHRYMLIFGTPVPGYHAPVERTQPAAQRVMEASLALLAEVVPAEWSASTDPLDAELEAWAAQAGIPPMPGALLRQALYGWTRLHGILSLEIEGHFGMGLPDPELLYRAEVEELDRVLMAFIDRADARQEK